MASLTEDLADFSSREVPLMQDMPAACLVLASRWVERRTGRDLLPEWVRFLTAEGAQAAASGWGGLPLQVGRVMRREGFHLVVDPAPGDVGVLKVAHTIPCGVRTRSGWLTWMDHRPAWIAASCTRCVSSWRIG